MAPDVGLVSGASERDADVLSSHGARDRLGDRRLAHARRTDEKQDRTLRLALLLALLRLALGLGGARDLVGRFRFGGGRLGFSRFLCSDDFRGLVGCLGARLLVVVGRASPLLFLGPLQAELSHRQELEHPVLHVLKTVVVLLEDPGGLLDVELFVAAFVPGQLRHGLEVGADDLRLHRLAADAAQAADFPIDLLAYRHRQFERLQAIPELVDLAAVVGLAELLLDGSHLLAQDGLSLAIAELLAHLALDIALGLEHRQLALDMNEDRAQALLDREDFEQLLTLGRRDVDMGRHQVGEAAGLGGHGQCLLGQLFGQSGALGELESPLTRLAEQSDEGGIMQIGRRDLGRRNHRGHQVALALRDPHRDRAALAVQDQLHAGETAMNLADPGDRADGVEPIRADLVEILPLGQRQDLGLGVAQRGVNGPERSRAARPDGHRDAGKEDRLAKRQDGELQLIGHSSLLGPRLQDTLARRPVSSASTGRRVCEFHEAKWIRLRFVE